MVARFCKFTNTPQTVHLERANFMVCQLYVHQYLQSFAFHKSIPELPCVPGWEPRARSLHLLLSEELRAGPTVSNTMVLKVWPLGRPQEHPRGLVRNAHLTPGLRTADSDALVVKASSWSLNNPPGD